MHILNTCTLLALFQHLMSSPYCFHISLPISAVTWPQVHRGDELPPQTCCSGALSKHHPGHFSPQPHNFARFMRGGKSMESQLRGPRRAVTGRALALGQNVVIVYTLLGPLGLSTSYTLPLSDLSAFCQPTPFPSELGLAKFGPSFTSDFFALVPQRDKLEDQDLFT